MEQFNWNVAIVTPYALLHELLLSLGHLEPRVSKATVNKMHPLYQILAMFFGASLLDDEASQMTPCAILYSSLVYLQNQGTLEKYGVQFGEATNLLYKKYLFA